MAFFGAFQLHSSVRISTLCGLIQSMRAGAILGTGKIARAVDKFQRHARVEWTSLLEQADIAVLFGGDGTIHRHLNTLVELDLPLLVVPCGSGNDFARALNLRRVGDALGAWAKFLETGENVRSVDLGTIELSDGCSEASESKYFSSIAGVGLDSEIAKRANSLPGWLRSNGGYALSAPREFLHFPPFSMRFALNGTLAAFQPSLLAAVANAPSYGGGMKIAPRACLDDGKLDVCIVRAMDKFKLFCLFPTVYFGRHLDFREVEYLQAPAVKIETEHPLDIYADGEYAGQTPVEFGVAPRALKVIVP
jgi:diacylglycerol kinase (ATP)